jgi:hypothetical protein
MSKEKKTDAAAVAANPASKKAEKVTRKYSFAVPLLAHFINR